MLAVCLACAAPLQIWRVNVTSVRGEPLQAQVLLQTAQGEQIEPQCLSLGDERDAPEPDFPLLRHASFALSPSGDSIAITTNTPINASSVSVVLRVQCPGEPSYVRVVNLHLRTATKVERGTATAEQRPVNAAASVPPPAAAAPRAIATTAQKGPGTDIKVRPGDTLYKLARLLYPRNVKAEQELVKAIVLVNPELFPDQKSRPLQVGETLHIPDLRSVEQILKHRPKLAATRPPPAATLAATAPSATPSSVAPPSPPVPASTAPAPRAAAALALRISTEIDLSRIGASERKRTELRRLYSGVPRPQRPAETVPSPATEQLELKADHLRESQNLIDQQLGKLEQAVNALSQAVIASSRIAPPQPAPMPPAPTKQVFVRETPYWLWPAMAGSALLIALLAFLFGRRISQRRMLYQHEERIDRLLAEARTAAGPLLSQSEAPRAAASADMYRPEPEARPSSSRATRADRPTAEPPSVQAAEEHDDATQTMPEGITSVDLEVGAEPEAESPGVSTNLRQQMQEALENTRSMFTDVDRFIALGRIDNAVSLLEFQLQKDPKDHDSWVKLLAVYQQEGRETEFEKAHREFKRHFPAG